MIARIRAASAEQPIGSARERVAMGPTRVSPLHFGRSAGTANGGVFQQDELAWPLLPIEQKYRTLELAPGTPVEIWFRDEIRVGQQNKLTYRWPGIRRSTNP